MADLFTPTESEQSVRDALASRLLLAITNSETIYLPPYDPTLATAGESALVTVGIEPNPWGGTVGNFRYQLEGEEDLLHLIIVRLDGRSVTPSEGRTVAQFVWDGVPPALVWHKPGILTQHFYVGHDDLVGSLRY
ncbi:MAG: hypothetical protein KF812_10175 [Fimbriimonadaceae bacterium]|nr:hypothetical protein [Fimbriimonadaceae bacterium]